MQRFLLIHEGQRILLSDGETMIGRGLSCRIRFNDPAVSRAHLRIMVQRGVATAENLSANGTLVNARRIQVSRRLADGDEIRIGYRRIRVEVVEEGEAVAPRRSARDSGSLNAFEHVIAEDETNPGEEGWRQRRTLTSPPPTAPISPRSLIPIQAFTCPRCRASVHYTDETCQKCGYEWPPSHPAGHTQRIDVEGVTARKEPRYAVEVPVIYSSATLTIDAIVRDLSRGGMFIATELLDPVGTPCEITALPDGHSALRFTGVVAHVSDDAAASPSRASGLGIRIVNGSPEAVRWLERTVARYEDAIVK